MSVPTPPDSYPVAAPGESGLPDFDSIDGLTTGPVPVRKSRRHRDPSLRVQGEKSWQAAIESRRMLDRQLAVQREAAAAAGIVLPDEASVIASLTAYQRRAQIQEARRQEKAVDAALKRDAQREALYAQRDDFNRQLDWMLNPPRPPGERK